MNTQILGLHHVTAMTSSAEKIYHFFTDILGLRLIKKTVNQDDIETYHLFFADDAGSPGTDMTFFDFPGLPKGTKGTNTISRTSFRVKDDAALDYWVSRFNEYAIDHGEIQERFGKKYLDLKILTINVTNLFLMKRTKVLQPARLGKNLTFLVNML